MYPASQWPSEVIVSHAGETPMNIIDAPVQ